MNHGTNFLLLLSARLFAIVKVTTLEDQVDELKYKHNRMFIIIHFLFLCVCVCVFFKGDQGEIGPRVSSYSC